MNQWNRVAISLVALFLFVAAMVTLLVASEAVDPDFLPGGANSWFEDELLGLANFDSTGKSISIIVAVAVAIAMVAVVYFETMPLMGGPDTLQISDTTQGTMNIEATSVRLLAERVGISNRNVDSLHCRIRARGRPLGGGASSISITCYPRVILGSDVREIRDDLQTRIKQSVQDLTGLTVLRVHVVRVRYHRDDSSRLMGA